MAKKKTDPIRPLHQMLEREGVRFFRLPCRPPMAPEHCVVRFKLGDKSCDFLSVSNENFLTGPGGDFDQKRLSADLYNAGPTAAGRSLVSLYDRDTLVGRFASLLGPGLTERFWEAVRQDAYTS